MRSALEMPLRGKAKWTRWLSAICLQAVSPAAASQACVSIAAAPVSVVTHDPTLLIGVRQIGRSAAGTGSSP